mgnify:FL=1
MPHKTYILNCTCNTSNGNVEYCPDCNLKGEYNGLGLSMTENMCVYVLKTGFQPFGRHRHLLDRIFFEYWKYCENCNGIGIIEDGNDGGYQYCQCCGRKGGFYIGDKEEWDRMIYEVLSAYPDSAGGNYKAKYQDIYDKYKRELDHPTPVFTNEDIVRSHKLNGGGIFDVK